MYYQLTVIKKEPNQEYAAQLEEYSRKSIYARNYPEREPQETVTRDVLMVELTPDQWEAVKQAVLKTFR